jgi:hypothetical protein
MAFLCGKDANIDEDIADMIELEKYLKTAEVLEVEIDSFDGRTAPWGVMLDDGKTIRQALFKYVNRPRPTHLPDSYHYEIAAYKLSKLLEYPLIPPVVEREINETPGSLQLLLEGCFSLQHQQREGLKPADPQKFLDGLSDLAIFENLVFCEPNTEDVFIQENDWKIWRVDFSEAFDSFVELDSKNEITKCSKALFHNLKKLDEREIRIVLESHCNKEEIDALLERKNLIIERITLLIKEKGEEAVLF